MKQDWEAVKAQKQRVEHIIEEIESLSYLKRRRRLGELKKAYKELEEINKTYIEFGRSIEKNLTTIMNAVFK